MSLRPTLNGTETPGYVPKDDPRTICPLCMGIIRNDDATVMWERVLCHAACVALISKERATP